MDMFNKLKSAVSSALPGNPLSKDFEVYGQIGTAGPGLLWKIYSGMKKTTKQDAAIFLFEKKTIENYSRRDKELILEALKRGASQLTRLRHPKILSVLQPLEESRESLAFATEPVLASLANILGNLGNLPQSVGKELKEHWLYDVEIKYGILQVTEALQFLHQDVKLLHNNVCPESIMVNKNGAWKLAGFEFCVQNKSPPDEAALFPYKDWDLVTAPCAQPNLDYMAPEQAISESCSLACDMFSVGMLIYALFNSGKPLYECNNQLTTFKKNAEELRKWRGSLLGKIPEELQDVVKLLFNAEPTVRPDPNQLAQIPFFKDVGSVTLQYMDTLFQQDNLPKSRFFKGLPQIIIKLPKRVNLQRILPQLYKECVNPDMIPFVLPNILQIANQATDEEYCKLILPELVPIFRITSPVQILLILMQNMSLLLKKTPASDVKTHVLPIVYRALESNNSEIQELSLNIIPTFADMIDYTTIKNSLVPRIKSLCLTTSVTGVRVNCLLCLGKMLESMDKWFVLDEILPLLPMIPSRESAVLMSILGIYKVALTHEKLGISKDLLAGKVVPFLMTVCIEHSLNLGQFTAFITLIKEMIDKLESEHRNKLEQLEQMKQEQKNMEISTITEESKTTLISGIDDSPKTMMDTFLSNYSVSGTGNKTFGASSVKSVPLSPALSNPAKVTLSLEEKQRIAEQQEQQRYLQAAKPLETKSSLNNSHNKSKQSSNVSKDLTNSLIHTNVMRLSLSSNSHSAVANFSPGLNMLSNIGDSSMGTTTQPTIDSTTYRFLEPNTNQGGLGFKSRQPMSQYSSELGSSNTERNKNANISLFDNLLSDNSQNKNLSVDQISQRSGVASVPNHSMIGKQNLIASQGVMGQKGMMSKQSMPGQQTMMVSSGQGMMDSRFLGSGSNYGYSGGMNFQQGSMTKKGSILQWQPAEGPNIMQPQILSNQCTRSMSAKNDFDDLIG